MSQADFRSISTHMEEKLSDFWEFPPDFPQISPMCVCVCRRARVGERPCHSAA